MRCSNCHEEFANDLKECPKCGTSVALDEIVDLPKLNDDKKEDVKGKKIDNDSETMTTKEFHFNFENSQVYDESEYTEKTKEFPSLTSMLSNLSENIEHESNEDNEEFITINSEEDNQNEQNLDETKENILKIKDESSYDVKRKYLFVSGLICLIVIGLLVFTYASFKDNNDTNKNNKVDEYDYKNEIDNALANYYKSGGKETGDLVKVLEEVYNDKYRINKVQKETLNVVEQWIDDYLVQNAEDTASFLDITDYYKELVNNLYEKAIYEEIYLLDDADKDNFLDLIDDVCQDGMIYYKALDFYNDKSYNEAYVSLDDIDDDNYYYNDVVNLKEEIISDVLKMLNNDIDKLKEKETDEDSLNKNASSIIEQYNNIYADLNLKENPEYEKLSLKYMISK